MTLSTRISQQDGLNDDPGIQANETLPAARSPGLALTSTPVIPSTSGTPTIQFKQRKNKKDSSDRTSSDSEISESELTFSNETDTLLEGDHSPTSSDTDNEEPLNKSKVKKEKAGVSN